MRIPDSVLEGSYQEHIGQRAAAMLAQWQAQHCPASVCPHQGECGLCLAWKELEQEVERQIARLN